MGDFIDKDRFLRKLGAKMASADGVDPIRMELGWDLLMLVDPALGGELQDKIGALRVALADELGFVIPPVHVVDHPSLDVRHYRIRIGHKLVTQGVAHFGHLLLLSEHLIRQAVNPPDEAMQTLTPDGAAAYWVPPGSIPESLKTFGQQADDAIVAHLGQFITSHVRELRELMNY